MIKQQDITNALSELQAKDNQLSQSTVPQGEFSAQRIKTLTAALTGAIQALTGDDVDLGSPTKEEPFPAQVARSLRGFQMTVQDAISEDALPPDFDISQEPQTDQDLMLLIGKIKSAVASKDFKKWFKSKGGTQPQPEQEQPTMKPPKTAADIKKLMMEQMK